MMLRGVWFRYGRRNDWTLRAVDVAVRPADTVVVLGRNGAGKSTLLQLAAGVLRPVRGSLHERPRVVGWVPERFPAEQPFTCAQYLAHSAALRGLHARAAVRAVDGWVQRLGLAPHLDSRLAALSKGTAQKVGLAQALLVPPDLLVLDEPWEGLDSVARAMVPQIVAEVTGAGGAVLISDHRGEIDGLPDPIRWSVEDGTVRPVAEPCPIGSTAVLDAEAFVEIAVRRGELADTLARLRAAGHDVRGVRATPSAAPAADPGAAPVSETPQAETPQAGASQAGVRR